VALCVLAATAVLTGSAPAKTAAIASGAGRAGQVSASGHDYATAVRATLTLTPGVAGRNDYVLWVDDYDTGDPLTTVTSVTMKCSLTESPSVSPVTVKLDKAANDSWTGSGLDFSVAGRWKVEVAVQEEAKGTVVPLALTIRAGPAP
jgi:hypothetical protein